MIQWECEITARRDDGALRWRRSGATEPNGWLPADLVPRSVDVGSIVIIDFVNEIGRYQPVGCRPRDVVQVTLQVTEPTEPEDTPLVFEPAPGHLHLTNIMNPLENENAEGKLRPAVLVSKSGDSWRVMGLTSKSAYSTGQQRRPIPNHEAVGLWGPGYIWGNRLTRVSAESIQTFIGVADYRLVEEIIDIARNDMSSSEIDDLRSVTRPDVQTTRQWLIAQKEVAAPRISLDAESLLRFLSSNAVQARQDLTDYFHTDKFTGRHFENYSRRSNPTSFDGNDVAAVMCLGVRVESTVPSALLAVTVDPVISESTAPLWNRPIEDFLPGSPLHSLYSQLRSIENIGPTIASKLLASKFPSLVPIWDRDVSLLLGRPEQWWLGWHEAMQSKRLRSTLQGMRDDLGLEGTSLLRIMDVALWMEAQRRKKAGLL